MIAVLTQVAGDVGIERHLLELTQVGQGKGYSLEESRLLLVVACGSAGVLQRDAHIVDEFQSRDDVAG